MYKNMSLNGEIIFEKGTIESQRKFVKEYVKNNLVNFNFNKPNIVGESKKIYKDKKSNLCLIEFIPSLYSFTQNRYGTVKDTNLIRINMWSIMDIMMTKIINSYLKDRDSFLQRIKNNDLCQILDNALEKGVITKSGWNSGYYGNIEIDGNHYAMATFIDKEYMTPLEFVYKTKLNGTMKHNLDNVDKFNTLYSNTIKYEEELPRDIVRFDWRNPLWKGDVRRKDECIPDDFAAFYTNVDSAKIMVRLYSKLINFIFSLKGYSLVDVCYFIDSKGTTVFSEVSLDCMRVTKKGESFDKDLWRQGKDEDTIVRVWTEFYNDISSIDIDKLIDEK